MHKAQRSPTGHRVFYSSRGLIAETRETSLILGDSACETAMYRSPMHLPAHTNQAEETWSLLSRKKLFSRNCKCYVRLILIISISEILYLKHKKMFKCFLTLNTNFSAFTFVAILLVSSRCDVIQCKRKFKASTARQQRSRSFKLVIKRRMISFQKSHRSTEHVYIYNTLQSLQNRWRQLTHLH